MRRLRFLGTGWSHGVPMLGCECAVCQEQHPRNVRSRPSILLEWDGFVAVVDTGPDFRQQALRENLAQLDAVLITHQHADHVMGMDDIRRFTWSRSEALPIYSDAQTLQRLRVLYPYVSENLQPGKAVPKISFKEWSHPQQVGPFRISPLRVPHGDLICHGLLIETPAGKQLGYVPDTSGLPQAAEQALRGIDIMILNALRIDPHPSHLSLEQSLELLSILQATRSYLTHMGCPLDYLTLNPSLPTGVEMAYDGLALPLD